MFRAIILEFTIKSVNRLQTLYPPSGFNKFRLAYGKIQSNRDERRPTDFVDGGGVALQHIADYTKHHTDTQYGGHMIF